MLEFSKRFKMSIRLLIFYIYTQTCLCVCSVNDTELLLAFMIHRHGDRTPVEESLKYAHDKDKVVQLSEQYGYGELTNVGLRHAFNLGEFIRHRYSTLLSPKYNNSEVYIRSTDKTRTKMTVLNAMRAVYSPSEDNNGRKDINWTSVLYSTVPLKYEHMLSPFSCPTLEKAVKGKNKEDRSLLNKYRTLQSNLSKILAVNVSSPMKFFTIHDQFVSQKSLGVPLSPELDRLFPEVTEAAVESFRMLFGDEKYIHMAAGVMLNDFFVAINKAIAGENVPKVHIYSSHDFAVYVLGVITRVKPQLEIPEYTALLSLELRKDKLTGQYFILPVYLKNPDEKEIFLQVEGCLERSQYLCELDSFRELTYKNVLNMTGWKTECKFDENKELSLTLDFD